MKPYLLMTHWPTTQDITKKERGPSGPDDSGDEDGTSVSMFACLNVSSCHSVDFLCTVPTDATYPGKLSQDRRRV